MKDGVGTAYSSSSRLWFTVWNGVVTEVYYPTVDRPQLRDLQFLVTDGESFFHCAATFARERGDGATAAFLEEYADFLECHVEAWMVTTEGTLVPGIPRHFIRILPVDVNDPFPIDDPNLGVLALANRPPGSRWEFPAKEIVDGGFLELVRYGIRKADDPVIVDSLRVLDAVLKVDTPAGPCWRRYNNDGYGQREDGGPFVGYGKGRAWPLLTGERGHYELAAGRPPGPYLKAMEGSASPTGLLPTTA